MNHHERRNSRSSHFDHNDEDHDNDEGDSSMVPVISMPYLNSPGTTSTRKTNKFDVSTAMSRLSGTMVGTTTTNTTGITSQRNVNDLVDSSTFNESTAAAAAAAATTVTYGSSSTFTNNKSGVSNNDSGPFTPPRSSSITSSVRRKLGLNDYYANDEEFHNLLPANVQGGGSGGAGGTSSFRRNHGLNDYYLNDEEYNNLLFVTKQQQQQQSPQRRREGVNSDNDNNFDDDDDDLYKLNNNAKNYDTFQQQSNLNKRNDDEWNMTNTKSTNDNEDSSSSNNQTTQQKTNTNSMSQKLMSAFHQIPAVALIAMFHLMIGIPFGVSYFPIGWKEPSEFYNSSPSMDMNVNSTLSSSSAASTSSGGSGFIDGPFPIEGKNALGIRMFLFSTIMGQIIFTFQSGFKNPIGLNMVENVPFCQALATITIEHCGYGLEALSTLFVMFGLSSIIVGVVFYILGKFELGRIIYFFPSHVLVGLIAGIGIFICKTGVEVAMNAMFSLESIYTNVHLLLVVMGFELLLRFLERWNVKHGTDGKPVFALLSPIYFCSITPVFYGILWMIGVSVTEAEQNGYFFPSLVGNCDGNDSGCSTNTDGVSSVDAMMSFMTSTIFNKDVFDIWRLIDFSNVSWAAIRDSIPTLIAITIFSLIHVPINIPAFAISTNSEYDMNKELIAHGYSNCLSGIFGGLQNYMAYTQSILYDRSGGYGRPSGIAVAIVTAVLFFFGPSIASAIPRCMAGTLLVHVGIDLFLEGVYDTLGKFERLEYAGIWLIALVMTFSGMDAAMIAGAIAAVSTYAVQTVAYLDPVRGKMSAATLRSSQRNRGFEVNAILDSVEHGRSRILVVQLQGHLFFGNVSQLNKSFNQILSPSKPGSIKPLIVIVDFSLVLGIDSSAAQAIIKLKKLMMTTYDTKLCIFVPGSSDGFPCEYELTNELNDSEIFTVVDKPFFRENVYTDTSNEETAYLMKTLNNSTSFKYEGSQVCQTLDFALALSENALIAWHDPELLQNMIASSNEMTRTNLSQEDEKILALFYLAKICSRSDISEDDVKLLFSFFKREVCKKDELIWRQGSPSDCAKLLVSGKLIAKLENEAGTYETVQVGRMCGELGLVAGIHRMNSLYCMSDQAILYSISKESFNELTEVNAKLARIMDLICIDYLADRVQHVSNRIFETRCLPI